jgi:hypothetical protein
MSDALKEARRQIDRAIHEESKRAEAGKFGGRRYRGHQEPQMVPTPLREQSNSPNSSTTPRLAVHDHRLAPNQVVQSPEVR